MTSPTVYEIPVASAAEISSGWEGIAAGMEPPC